MPLRQRRMPSGRQRLLSMLDTTLFAQPYIDTLVAAKVLTSDHKESVEGYPDCLRRRLTPKVTSDRQCILVFTTRTPPGALWLTCGPYLATTRYKTGAIIAI